MLLATIRRLLAVAVLVVMSFVSSTIGTSAKSLIPANQYGPINVTFSTRCPTTTTIVNLPINPADKIHDITVSGVVNGDVHLFDKNGLVNVSSNVIGGTPYSFTTTTSDVLQACTNSGSDSDVTFQGELSLFSSNYAGYTVEGLNASPNKYETVEANWNVPAILSCSFSEKSDSAIWIGLGGAPNTGSTEIMQIGTDQQCNHGIRYEVPIYEDFYPGQKGGIRIDNACPISVTYPCAHPFTPSVFANDLISAKVAHQTDGSFFLFETDSTQKWTAREVLSPKTSTVQYSAEWIEEAPIPILTKIGQVTFTNCFADNQPLGNAGPSTQKLTMRQDPSSPIQAQPSGIVSGNSFSVQ